MRKGSVILSLAVAKTTVIALIVLSAVASGAEAQQGDTIFTEVGSPAIDGRIFSRTRRAFGSIEATRS